MSIRHAALLHAREIAEIDAIPDDDRAAQKYIRGMTGYDPSSFADEPADTDDMVADFGTMQQEERRSAKIGAREDYIEELRQQGLMPKQTLQENPYVNAKQAGISNARSQQYKSSSHTPARTSTAQSTRASPQGTKAGKAPSAALAEMFSAKRALTSVSHATGAT